MTAYEMRISDWSSDVCSSDLVLLDGACRRSPIEADVIDHRSVEQRPDRSEDIPFDAVVADMEIGDRTAPEFGCEIAIGRDGIGDVDLIETPSGRQFHRDETGRSRSCDRVHDRQTEGRSALNAAAP